MFSRDARRQFLDLLDLPDAHLHGRIVVAETFRIADRSLRPDKGHPAAHLVPAVRRRRPVPDFFLSDTFASQVTNNLKQKTISFCCCFTLVTLVTFLPQNMSLHLNLKFCEITLEAAFSRAKIFKK